MSRTSNVLRAAQFLLLCLEFGPYKPWRKNKGNLLLCLASDGNANEMWYNCKQGKNQFMHHSHFLVMVFI